jgi:hypothetical protein
MSLRDDARSALFDAIITDFAAAYPAVPIELENHKFEQPESGPFLSLYLRFYSSEPTTINSTRRFVRHWGFMCADVMVPEDTGTKAIWDMAEVVENALAARGFNLPNGGNLSCFVPKTTPPTRSQGFYLVSVMAPFHLDGCY